MAFNPAHCGACGFTEGLHEHHIVPRTQGGLNLPTVYLCVPCHAAVHNRTWDPDHAILIKASMADAKKRGVHTGRKHTLRPHQRAEAARLHGEGQSLGKIAALLGCGRPVVHRAIHDGTA